MTVDINSALAGNFMQVKVTVRKWTGKVTDKDLSAEMEGNKHARSGSLRAVKDLLAGANDELREVNSALDAVRTFTYSRTLPWASNADGALKGPRLLPVADSVDFLKEYKALSHQVTQSLRHFMSVYEYRVEEAKRNLGDAAKDSDYPTKEEIAAKFHLDIDINPVQEVTDFTRMSIPANVASFLGERMAKKQEQALNNAMTDLFTRVLEQVQRMATQLGKQAETGDARLYKSLVENTRQLNQLLAASNVTQDERIDELTRKIDKALCQHDVEVYKTNETVTKQAAQQAQAIAKDIGDLMEWY